MIGVDDLLFPRYCGATTFRGSFRKKGGLSRLSARSQRALLYRSLRSTEMTTSEKAVGNEAQDELAALDALEKEASEFNKVLPSSKSPYYHLHSI